MSVIERLNVYGIAEGATWGTAVTVGVNNGIYFQSFDGFPMDSDQTVDKGAGMGQESNSVTGNDKPVEPSFVIWPYENDHTALFILALIMGADAITGAGDPYTHAMAFQDESGKFVSIIGQEGTETKTIPSAVLQTLEITPNSTGIIEFKGKFHGNTVTVAGATGSVTYKANELPFLFKNLVMRINDQSGAGLAVGDAIEISDFKISIARPSKGDIVTGATTISAPNEGEFPTFLLEFKIPAKTADSVSLYTDYRAGTLKKLDMTFSGSGATRELLLDAPQVKLESVSNPHDDVISTTVMARLQKASAAPTGMTATVPTFAWQNDESASVLA